MKSLVVVTLLFYGVDDKVNDVLNLQDEAHACNKTVSG